MKIISIVFTYTSNSPRAKGISIFITRDNGTTRKYAYTDKNSDMLNDYRITGRWQTMYFPTSMHVTRP